MAEFGTSQRRGSDDSIGGAVNCCDTFEKVRMTMKDVRRQLRALEHALEQANDDANCTLHRDCVDVSKLLAEMNDNKKKLASLGNLVEAHEKLHRKLRDRFDSLRDEYRGRDSVSGRVMMRLDGNTTSRVQGNGADSGYAGSREFQAPIVTQPTDGQQTNNRTADLGVGEGDADGGYTDSSEFQAPIETQPTDGQQTNDRTADLGVREGGISGVLFENLPNLSLTSMARSGNNDSNIDRDSNSSTPKNDDDNSTC